jgi:hypothetical protein
MVDGLDRFMRHRKIVVGILVLVACGVLAVVFWPEKPEPVYKGKKLSEWVIRFNPFRALSRSQPYFDVPPREVDLAVDAFGTNAIPYYIEWMNYKPGFLNNLAVGLAARDIHVPGFTNFQADFQLRRMIGSYWGIVNLHEKGAPAIPTLLRLRYEPEHKLSTQTDDRGVCRLRLEHDWSSCRSSDAFADD